MKTSARSINNVFVGIAVSIACVWLDWHLVGFGADHHRGLVQGQSACPSRAEVGLRLMSRRPPCSFSISTARRIRPKACNAKTSRVVWLPCPRLKAAWRKRGPRVCFVVYSLGGSAAPQDIATAIAPSANDPVVKSGPNKFVGTDSTSCSTTRNKDRYRHRHGVGGGRS